MKPILVWDWPVRLGHWLLVGGFVVAWLTSESESQALVHAGAGAVMVAVALFRLVWGFAGTHHALFRSFVSGPGAVVDYLKGMVGLQPAHYTGHNPAGGWAIVALLTLAVLTGATGWATMEEMGGHWLEELHEGLAATMLTVVIVHVGGVISGSWLHKENLVRAMVTGRKLGHEGEAITSALPLVAALLALWVAAACYWVIR